MTTDLAVIERNLPALVDDAIQLFDERQVAKLALLLSESESILRAEETAPEDDASEARLVALIGRAYKVEKEADNLRRQAVDPLNAQVKAINGIVKRAFDLLLVRFGKGSEGERRLTAYRRAKAARIQREQDEARRRQEEAARREGEALAKAEAAKTEAARKRALAEAEAASRQQMAAELSAPLPMTRGVRTDDGSITTSEVWDFEIADAALVPRTFCRPDEQAIRAAVKAGVREIAGVNVYQREQIRRGV